MNTLPSSANDSESFEQDYSASPKPTGKKYLSVSDLLADDMICPSCKAVGRKCGRCGGPNSYATGDFLCPPCREKEDAAYKCKLLPKYESERLNEMETQLRQARRECEQALIAMAHYDTLLLLAEYFSRFNQSTDFNSSRMMLDLAEKVVKAAKEARLTLHVQRRPY